MKSGMLINFEGLDYSGKTTAIKTVGDALCCKFKGSGIRVVTVSEPGTTAIGMQIRDILHDMKNDGMSAQAEALLYQASRAELVDKIIKPELAEGSIVLMDRFYHSSIAYQGFGRNLGVEEIRNLSLFATGGIKPEMTVLFDIPVGEMLKRRENDPTRELNRMDVQELYFYEKVRYGYIVMASGNLRWVTIDATRSKEVVAREAERRIMERLVLKGFVEGQMKGKERW